MSYALPALAGVIAIISVVLSPRAASEGAFFRGLSADGRQPGLMTLTFSQVTTWIFARSLLNAGAIGLPANDGTRDGWYLLLEPTTGGSRASWHRLVYDAEQAAAAMRARGLSGGYDGTLLTGLWPSLDVLPEQERLEQGVALSLPAMVWS